MAYIEAAHDEPEGCLFCELLARDDDQSAFILARDGAAFALLNAYPYNPGHLMVAPTRHVGDVEDLDADELVDTGRLMQRAVGALRQEMDPHGFNLGANLGRVAGAGIPGHVHWHVVPRVAGRHLPQAEAPVRSPRRLTNPQPRQAPCSDWYSTTMSARSSVDVPTADVRFHCTRN